jgi:sorting nexin-1/2
LIEIWETFLMQLDTEEGENFNPPAGVIAPPTGEQPLPAEENNDPHAPAESEHRPEAESENEG